MARQPTNRPAQQRQDDPPIEGEVVESTERAMSVLASTAGQVATLDQSMVAILTKAELDQMVVTARANPRSIQLALDATREIACLDIQTATECGYALPRGRDDQSGKANVITGPSVRLAEIVACQWGNCQAASRVTDVNRAEGWVEAEGIFIDFQTNYRVTARVRRSIRSKPYQGKPGKVFSDDMINVTSNAAAAIAFRNAVFKGVPKPIWNNAYQATLEIVRGDAKSLGARRVDLLTAFRDNLQIKPDRVYAILGVKGEQDIGLDELVVAAGFYSALKNNEVTLEDLIAQIAPTATTAGKTLGDANTAKGAAPAQTTADPAAHTLQRKDPPHDPETGEVQESADTGDTGQAAGPAADDGGAGDTPAQVKGDAVDAGEVIDGWADPGETYLFEEDSLDDKGRRQTYQDGVPFSTVGPKGQASLKAYTTHAPRIAKQDAADDGADDAAADIASADARENDDDDDDAGARGISNNPEDRQDPAQQLQTDEAADPHAPPTNDELQRRGEEFTIFDERVDAASSWLTIKGALSTLRRTEAYKAARPGIQQDAIVYAVNATMKLIAANSDPVRPDNDPSFFMLWTYVADRADVRPTFQRLMRTQAYGALNDDQKDAVVDAADRADPQDAG